MWHLVSFSFVLVCACLMPGGARRAVSVLALREGQTIFAVLATPSHEGT